MSLLTGNLSKPSEPLMIRLETEKVYTSRPSLHGLGFNECSHAMPGAQGSCAAGSVNAPKVLM
jgi:hypothetical protein